MFGYVVAASELLSEEQKKRYKELYCGLCRTLDERHGAAARLTLTYDMTFLVILLSSLYEPEEQVGTEKCPVHPMKEHGYIRSEITDYAADMNMVLAYLNRIDDWRDDGRLISLAEAAAMKKAYLDVSGRYPRQCSAIEKNLAELTQLENSRDMDPDAAAACFGRLMAELFVYKEDYWSGYLRSLGMALGKFIYIMDACIDLKGDKRYYRYNPMLPLYGRINEAERFEDILKMLMAQCVEAFEALPLVQDADLMRNILCFGVWIEFNKHYERYRMKDEGEVPDGAGPL